MERKAPIVSEEHRISLRNRTRLKRIFAAIALIVLTATVAALVLPAISDSKTTYCGLEEHSHTESCYSRELICGFTDDTTADDTTAEETSVSGEKTTIAEAEDTTDNESETSPAETQPETKKSHNHSDECYKKIISCTVAEHSHSLSCMSDPSADVETLESIESMMEKLELTGDDGKDILEAAKSQLGYSESSLNFAVEADGISRRGYTRYGAWYGDSYADWNSIFVSFCAHFANVDVLTSTDDCADWVTMLKDNSDSLYYSADEHLPNPGDVIFFDDDLNGRADRVGIVNSFIKESNNAYVIEGDKNDAVANTLYDLSDDSVLGYIKLATPQNESYSLINVSGTKMYHSPDCLEYQYSSHKADPGTAETADDFITLTYVLVPYDEYMAGTWTPNTVQWSAKANANYVVAYCADRNTDVCTDGEDYLTQKIFESAYEDCATVLSGIISNAYPYVTADRMKAALAEAYEKGEIPLDLSCCTESEFIAAAQWAIWDATSLSETQTNAFGSAFPSYNSGALNPLSDVGHTDSSDIQSHVKAIRDWLMTRKAEEPISILSDDSHIVKDADGTYTATSTVILSRPCGENEKITVKKRIGNTVVTDTVYGEGTDRFTIIFKGLTESEVLNIGVQPEVSVEGMQVFIYNSDSYQDMVSGQWGVDTYDLSFNIDVETTSVDVTKYWSDNHEDVDSVPVQLYADGKAHGSPVILSDENSWTYRWNDLVKYSAPGTPINYTVGEFTVPGYLTQIEKNEGGSKTETVTETADISYSVTSTKSEELTSLKVREEWTGRSDGKYPDGVTVQLLQNGEKYGPPVILNSDNSWSYIWEKLPEAVGDRTFTYSVEETEINGYTSEMTLSENDEGITVITIVNTWTPDHLPIKLNKVDMYDHTLLLPGAAFELFRVSDSENTVFIPGAQNVKGIKEMTFITGEDGKFPLDEILVGETYYLIEIGAPKGYNLLDDPIILCPEKNENGEAVLRIEQGEDVTEVYENDDGECVLLVESPVNYIIPETGGKGAAIYYLSGLLLITLAVILITKNKKYIFRRKTK